MKNSIKTKKAISIVLSVIILLFTTNVYAANDSFKTVLSTSASSVKRGETITITISLSDIAIESGEKGIGAYTAKLDFDSSILEYVSTSGTNKWEAPLYQEKQIVGNTTDGEVVKENQSIGTITFKVKENATLGETTIKLTNISGSNAQSDISSQDSTVKIAIVNNENTGNGSGNGNGNENGSVSGSGNETTGGNSSESTNSGNSSNKTNLVNTPNSENLNGEKLPQTGFYNTLIYTLIGVFVLIATMLLIRIKLLNKKQ